MKSNHGAIGASVQSSAQPVDGTTSTTQRDLSRRRLLTRVALGGAVLLAAVTVSLILSNCSGRSTESGATSSNAGGFESQAVPAGSAGSESVTALAVQSGPSSAVGVADTSSQSRSPDLAASVSDTLVVPGSIVEIVAEATADVTEILVWDGIHDQQPMVYDVDGKVWTTQFRVPLRPSSERLALSVTATNDLKRWRRVWVFVRVQREGAASEAVRSANTDLEEQSGCGDLDQ